MGTIILWAEEDTEAQREVTHPRPHSRGGMAARIPEGNLVPLPHSAAFQESFLQSGVESEQP